MNQVILIGNLTNDLELRHTTSGKELVSFNLAVSRDKENTDFINLIAFGNTAKLLHEYCKKGDKLGIEGSLHVSTYENKKGEKRKSVDVYVNRIEFLKPKEKKEESNPYMEFHEEHQEELEFTDEDFPFE